MTRWHGCIAGSVGLALTVLAAAAPPSGDRFAGFPPVGKHRPGERSVKVITSDAVTGAVRPRWTRAMGDLGGWPAMYRFKGTIYLVFPHVDGHRGKRFEGAGKLLCYASADEGKTWAEQPTPPQAPEQGTPEYVVADDKLYSYEYDAKRQTHVRVSQDGKTWGERQPAYKPPFYFWGAVYDPASKQFWAPPHAIPGVRADPSRQIDLIKSADGVRWELVSTVARFDNASESVLRFEEDRTLVVLTGASSPGTTRSPSPGRRTPTGRSRTGRASSRASTSSTSGARPSWARAPCTPATTRT
jgi:hypothetical protein